MNLEYTNSIGTYDIDIEILNGFKTIQSQKVDYVKSMNGRTAAFNYGSNYDKYESEITIVDTNSNIMTIAKALAQHIGQVTLSNFHNGERIFGAGIDYTTPIACNILNKNINYNQVTFRTSEIKLKLQAVSPQLSFRSDVSEYLPTLNYQLPVERENHRRDSAYSSEKFGDYGKITEVDDYLFPIESHSISLVFSQSMEETAQIEKYVNTQRSNIIKWEGLDLIELYNTDMYTNVMITGIITQQKSLNDWMVTIKLVTMPTLLPAGLVLSVANNGTNRLMYSTDSGASWGNYDIGEYDFWNIAFGKSSFCACSNVSGAILTSVDGFNFVDKTGSTGYNFVNIVYGNNRFIANDYNNARCYYSDNDGETWNIAAYSSAVNIFSSVYALNKFFFTTSLGSSKAKIYYSEDGISNYSLAFETVGNDKFEDITYGHAGFAVPSDNQSIVYKSLDGIIWSSVSLGNPVNIARRIAYGNGLYVGINQYGKVFVSSDLITFTEYQIFLPTEPARIWEGFIFDGEYFIAVSRSYSGYSSTARSTNGIDWEIVDPPEVAVWIGLASN